MTCAASASTRSTSHIRGAGAPKRNVNLTTSAMEKQDASDLSETSQGAEGGFRVQGAELRLTCWINAHGDGSPPDMTLHAYYRSWG